MKNAIKNNLNNIIENTLLALVWLVCIAGITLIIHTGIEMHTIRVQAQEKAEKESQAKQARFNKCIEDTYTAKHLYFNTFQTRDGEIIKLQYSGTCAQ